MRPALCSAAAFAALILAGVAGCATDTSPSYFGHFPPAPPPSTYFFPRPYPQPQFHSAPASNDLPSWGWGGHDAAVAGLAGAGGAVLGAASRSGTSGLAATAAPKALAGTTALRAEGSFARKAAIATEDEEGFELLRVLLLIFEL
jgi:hypothetical protein